MPPSHRNWENHLSLPPRPQRRGGQLLFATEPPRWGGISCCRGGHRDAENGSHCRRGPRDGDGQLLFTTEDTETVRSSPISTEAPRWEGQLLLPPATKMGVRSLVRRGGRRGSANHLSLPATPQRRGGHQLIATEPPGWGGGSLAGAEGGRESESHLLLPTRPQRRGGSTPLVIGAFTTQGVRLRASSQGQFMESRGSKVNRTACQGSSSCGPIFSLHLPSLVTSVPPRSACPHVWLYGWRRGHAKHHQQFPSVATLTRKTENKRERPCSRQRSASSGH